MKSRYRLITLISIVCVIAASSLFSLRAKAAPTESALVAQIINLLLADPPSADASAAEPPRDNRSDASDEKFVRSKRKIADRYVVVLDDDLVGPRGENSRAAEVANELSAIHGGRVDRVYTHAINGFAIEMNEGRAIALSKDPRVKYVEEDSEVSLSATQINPPWGLDRVDQPALPLNAAYNYNQTGAGIRVYVIDSGIRTTHADFGGRASVGYDAFGGSGQDCHGHGTHVAGTAGGTTWGVAKDVSLVGVRVFDCFGGSSTSLILAGVNWVTPNAMRPAVVNMSLGDVTSTALDTAVNNSINSGLTYVVAAGNEAQNACNRSPSRVGPAITVGATEMADQKASFSNFGICVDLFAPGVGITSAWSTSDTATQVREGTSMAAPHVAGAAAIYLQSNPGAAPAQVRAFLLNESTKGIVGNSNTSNNHLLFTSWLAAPIVATNIPPTASFTYNCVGQTCTFDGSASFDADGTVAAYHWNFDDFQTASGATAQFTFSQIGNHTVSLTVSDNLGEASMADSKTFAVFNTPVGTNVRVNQANGFAYVVFSQVTVAGNTRLDPFFGTVTPYGNTICTTCTPYSVTTTANFTAPITVSLDVPAGIDDATFNGMSLLWYPYPNFDVAPVNITTGRVSNGDGTREIIGQAQGLGTYALATQVAGPPPQTPPTLSNTAVTPVSENGVATLTGNISDPNVGDTFTLTVNWGDGSAPQAFNYAAGTTSFTQTHQYLDNPAGQQNGLYLLQMTLADSAGGQATWALNAGVSNVAPALSNIVATPSSITAGGSTTVTGTITDPGTMDSFEVTIDWRDGSAATVLNLPAQSTSFSSQHSYSNAGNYGVIIVIRDKDFAGTPYNPAVNIIVSDVPPPDITNLAATSPINENGTTSLSGNISSQSPGATYNLVVNWGDGSQPQAFNYQAGTTSFNESHQYLDNGVYTVNATLTSSSGGSDSGSASVNVNNLPPAISNLQLSPNPITVGGATNLTGTSTDPGTLDTQIVSINWGDGSPNTTFGLSPGETAISSGHIFTQAGDVSIDVTSTDKDGGLVTENIILTVVAAPPPPSPTPTPPRVGNAPFKQTVLNGSAFAGLTPGPDGRLYGVTYDGPVSDDVPDDPNDPNDQYERNLDSGTIYSVDRELTNRVDHYIFNNATDGNTPYNELTWVPSVGRFFGATSSGPALNEQGKIFTFDPVTNQVAKMPGTFTGEVWGSLVLHNGYLYGTVQSYPEECVFRLTPSNFAVTFMHCVSWGSSLQGVSVGDDGWLYGNALYSGLNCDPQRPASGCGEIFKLRPWNNEDFSQFDPQFQVIFQFRFYGGNGYPCPPGDKFCVRFPVSHNYPVQKLFYGSDGNLYGSTFYSVFRLNPHAANVTDSFRTLWNDGGGIQATVIEGLDGRLYFTDYGGGSDGTGRIASMNKDGSGVFELRNFDRDGANSTANGPFGRLFHDPLTNRIYGTSEYTGTAEPWPGTAFFIDVPPTEYRLSGSRDGSAPVAVDDALDIFVNDALVYTDGIAPSGNRPPIPIPEGYFKPGDVVKFEVRDVYGNCRMLSPIYLVDNFGNSHLMTQGIEISCGWPAGDNGVVFSDTFTIPGSANSSPVITNLSAPTNITEHGIAKLNFVVSDSNSADTLAITVDWGDGSSSVVPPTPAGMNIPFELYHQYLDDDPSNSPTDSKLIIVSVTDGLATDTESHGIQISNLAPFIGSLSVEASPIIVGNSVTLTGTFGDTGTLDSFTVLINWGDGSVPVQLNRPPGSTTFESTHQFTTTGSFTITATVRDDDTGEVTSSIPIVVSPIPPIPVPAAPTNLSATVFSINQVDLAWFDASLDETEFRIERCSGGKRCNNFSLIGTVAANTSLFSDLTAQKNTNYHYRVQACNAGGCSAYSNTAVVKTPRK